MSKLVIFLNIFVYCTNSIMCNKTLFKINLTWELWTINLSNIKQTPYSYNFKVSNKFKSEFLKQGRKVKGAKEGGNFKTVGEFKTFKLTLVILEL